MISRQAGQSQVMVPEHDEGPPSAGRGSRVMGGVFMGRGLKRLRAGVNLLRLRSAAWYGAAPCSGFTRDSRRGSDGSLASECFATTVVACSVDLR